MSQTPTDAALMDRAIGNAASVRGTTAPNPWVGAVVLTQDGALFDGATNPAGGAHAERVAIDAAGRAAQGSTLATTLEPCCHSGRTDACVDSIVEAEISRVVVGVTAPDSRVNGGGKRPTRLGNRSN